MLLTTVQNAKLKMQRRPAGAPGRGRRTSNEGGSANGITQAGDALGIEEEYLLVDPETGSRKPAAGRLHAALRRGAGTSGDHEFLQSQVEVGTSVCASVGEAHKELAHLRATVATCAREFGLRMIASSTHPWASWTEQAPVDLERYRMLPHEHQTLARRMVICMHVHAGIEDEDLRIDLMNQATYFLPHLLALSTSSPFWEGRDTGIKAFRPIIFGDLPRSGVPEAFDSFSDWSETLRILQETGLCDDATKIWWDLRPSAGIRPWRCASATSAKLDDAVDRRALPGDPCIPLSSPGE